tara:strand:- start:15 stop:122 length:108 start_codon:yes stop_codon:yes gene_type:complete
VNDIREIMISLRRCTADDWAGAACVAAFFLLGAVI